MSSLGSSQLRYSTKALGSTLFWTGMVPKMEPNYYKNEKSANNPLKTLYQNLVFRSRNQSQGTLTAIVELQELRQQNQNRDWTEKSVPPHHE